MENARTSNGAALNELLRAVSSRAAACDQAAASNDRHRLLALLVEGEELRQRLLELQSGLRQDYRRALNNEQCLRALAAVQNESAT
jgi:hypothetical protein